MTDKPIRILYVDDYPRDRKLVRDALEKEHAGFRVTEAASRAEFEARLAEGDYDLVLTDFNILGFDGLHVLDAVRATDAHVPVVIVTGTGSEEVAVEVMKRGAADYVIKSTQHIRRLPHTIRAALEQQRLKQERVQAEAALQQRLDELTVLHAVAIVGTEVTDEDTLIERVTRIIGETIYTNNFGVLLLDEAAGALRVHPSYQGVREETRDLAFPPGHGIVGTVAARGQPWRVPDVRREPAYLGVNPDTRSELCVPLKIGERVIGVVNAESARLDAFTKADEELLTTIAGQLVTAIEKVRLFEAEHQRAQQLAGLSQMGQTTTASLELTDVLEKVIAGAPALVGAEGVSVLLLENHDELVFAAVSGVGTSLQGHRMPATAGVAGEVVQTGRPVRVHDVAGRARIYREIEKASGYHTRALLAVPLILGDELLGVMEAVHTQPDAFRADDLQVLEAAASWAAIAIENARLFEQMRAGREQLQALSHRLVEVQEAERAHIARELHDEIGQTLTGLKIALQLSARQPDEAARQARLESVQTLIDELTARVEGMSLDLRPSMLDDLGLLPTLLWHVERYTARTNVHVHCKHTGIEGRRFAPEVETVAYRIVQEALTNVARHAGVSEVVVRLWVNHDLVGVQIEDEGSGFDPAVALAAGKTSGLAGMHERTTLLGGRLTIDSAPGAGTRLTAELPVRREA